MGQLLRCLLLIHRSIALKGPRGLVELGIFLLLLPFSILYGAIAQLRGLCYDLGFFSRYKVNIPVIAVGNLIAGGTGKTPVVDWLLKELLSQGKRPAVVSRGYGGTFSGQVGIVCSGEGPSMNAVAAGDEPFLLARRNPEATVLIARRRADGVKLAVEQFSADVVVLDDGFQHRAVHRDVDLVLLDATYPLANGWPFPAGLLREFPRALSRANFLLMTRSKGSTNFHFGNKPVFESQHRLADFAVDLTNEKKSFEDLMGLKLCAFAGIADPSSFFSALSSAGLNVKSCLSLGDHCSYDTKTLQWLRDASVDCDALITTEKDAVKLTHDLFSCACYQVPMMINIEDSSVFSDRLLSGLWKEDKV